MIKSMSIVYLIRYKEKQQICVVFNKENGILQEINLEASFNNSVRIFKRDSYDKERIFTLEKFKNLYLILIGEELKI